MAQKAKKSAPADNHDKNLTQPVNTELEQYLDFFTFSSDLMCIADQQFYFRKVNPTFVKTLGYTTAELCSRPYLEFVHPEDRPKTTHDHDIAFSPDGTMNFENRYIAKDGSIVWLSWSARPSPIDKDLVFAIARNITERKQAEEAIRQSEERLRLITDNVPAIVAYVGAQDLCYHFVNQVYANMIGLSPEQIIGRKVNEILGEEAFARAFPYIERARAGEKTSYDNIVPFQGKERWFNVRYTPEIDDRGQVRNIIVMAVDVTERKKSEVELDRQNGILNALLESLPMGVFMAEATSGKPIFANRTALQLLGRGILPDTTEATFAEVYKAFKLPERLPYPPQEMPIVLGMHGKRSRIDDMLIIRPDGKETMLEVFGTPVADSQDNVWASLVSFWDITERKQAETEKEKLELQNRQLQKSESLGRMAGAIAHHFNNQLQVVSGNLELALTEQAHSTSETAQCLKSAMHAAQRASLVSSLMLTYLGQAPLKMESLDLSEISTRNLPLLMAAMPKNVHLETDIPSPGPFIKANPSQIKQIMTNLLTNAWEASPNTRSEIRLSIKTVLSSAISEHHRLPVDSPLTHESYACLEVTDSGCGIPDQDIEKIFDPFFSTKFTGRGMGLAVVLGIVRGHDGVITVFSRPGQGSTIRVYFPRIEAEISHLTIKPAQPLKMQGSGTILIVEDDDMVRHLASAMLKKLGYSVIAAQDGVDAVEIFRKQHSSIRCILCDLTMPRMDGWETLSCLRQITPGIPVILASGYSEAQVMSGHHSEQPQAFLSKPYRTEQLEEAIRQALAERVLPR